MRPCCLKLLYLITNYTSMLGAGGGGALQGHCMWQLSPAIVLTFENDGLQALPPSP